ncbi:B12-binding domain-containing radical SAM protein [Mahella australiensis]|uniref:Radical SAM domain protein n=1 Tax=Mahella australiensis (strain DSM 15567 / CIP 107919 / 50-1 BON) TaxID=697281 RepID=F4A102_MAHA5|nr:B12-binding domain-containing radical SAM protein [Mahella australiensis]AEE98079.1 Radical SAM domain protein [Mahella australiensis 50-1 BON]
MFIKLIALNSSFTHTAVALYQLEAVASNIADIKIEEFTINDKIDYILGEIYSGNPDAVAFSCYIWNIDMIWRLCSALKKVLPHVTIILGGPEVSYDAFMLLKQHECIDYVVCGEGEEAFAKLLTLLKDGRRSAGGIEGVYYRSGDIICGSGFAVVSDMSDISTMAYAVEHVDASNRIVYYETSRGCPFRCSYCLSSTTDGIRYVPMGRVKDDLAHIMRSGAKQVKFLDRTFNAHRRRAMDIWRFITDYDKRPEGMRFHFEICADIIDDDMLEFLLSVPDDLFQFEIGIQSVNESSLKTVGRHTDLHRMAHVVAILARRGNIHLHLDLIAGLPNEDFSSFGRSFDYAYGLRPDVLQLGFLKLLKGSELRNMAEQFGYAYDDRPPYEVLFNDSISFDALCELHWVEDVLNKYYNSGRLVHTLNYIIKNFHHGAFDFYCLFGCYWHDRGYYGHGHKDEALYGIMADFVRCSGYEPIQLIRELIRLDYLLNHPAMSHPTWTMPSRDEHAKAVQRAILNDKCIVEKYMPHFADVDPKLIRKYVYVERFEYDIPIIISSGYTAQPLSKPVWLLIDTAAGKIFDVSRETTGLE